MTDQIFEEVEKKLHEALDQYAPTPHPFFKPRKLSEWDFGCLHSHVEESARKLAERTDAQHDPEIVINSIRGFLSKIMARRALDGGLPLDHFMKLLDLGEKAAQAALQGRTCEQ